MTGSNMGEKSAEDSTDSQDTPLVENPPISHVSFVEVLQNTQKDSVSSTESLSDAPKKQEPIDASLLVWQGLHPYSVLINLLPQMWRTLENIWPIVLFVLLGSGSSGQILDSVVVLFFVFLSVQKTVLHFLTLRYKFVDHKLVIKMGLFFTQARTIDPIRIQNIEITQNPIHKWFNLVELRIETAGDASTKGLLSALHIDKAILLQKTVERCRQNTDSSILENTQSMHLHTTTFGEIILFGLSARTVNAVLILSIGGSELLSVLQPQQAEMVLQKISLGVFLGLISVSFALSWIWSVSMAYIRYFKYTIDLTDHLQISSGFFIRRQTTIPIKKIQIFDISQPWLRRQMGFATIHIQTASLGIADGEQRVAEGIIPMVETAQVFPVLHTIISRTASLIGTTDILTEAEWNTPLQPPHKNALFYIILKNLLLALCVSGVVLMLNSAFFWIFIFAIPTSLAVSFLDFTQQGWNIHSSAIISRKGYLQRHTWILDRDKIQTLYVEQNLILRLFGLAQVQIFVAGSMVNLPLLHIDHAKRILQQLRTSPVQKQIHRNQTTHDTHEISEQPCP